MTAASKRYCIREEAIFVLNAISSKEDVTLFCEKQGVSPKTYYNWRKSLIKACEELMTRDSVLARIKQRERTNNISDYVAELRRAATER